MKKKLNLETWSRKEHYEFFKQFEDPFFGICVRIDCTKAYKVCKEQNESFFLYYLHKSLVAANGIESFRYRIADDVVYLYDEIHASPTINRPNGTFGFSYMDFYRDFTTFSTEAEKEIERVRSTTKITPEVSGGNVIHYTALPWIDFTSISHARHFSFGDSCPKIAFGKMTESNDGSKSMPVSVHVHHALMDGYHVAEFIDVFQQGMNE